MVVTREEPAIVCDFCGRVVDEGDFFVIEDGRRLCIIGDDPCAVRECRICGKPRFTDDELPGVLRILEDYRPGDEFAFTMADELGPAWDAGRVNHVLGVVRRPTCSDCVQLRKDPRNVPKCYAAHDVALKIALWYLPVLEDTNKVLDEFPDEFPPGVRRVLQDRVRVVRRQLREGAQQFQAIMRGEAKLSDFKHRRKAWRKAQERFLDEFAAALPGRPRRNTVTELFMLPPELLK